MFIEKTTDKVKSLFEKYEELELKDKLQILITILEEWSDNQINSLNEVNPNMLEDDVNIEIFNPQSLGLQNDVGVVIAQYLFIILEKENIDKMNGIVIDKTLSDLLKYTNGSKKIISMFEKLSFMEKIDVVTEFVIRFSDAEVLKLLEQIDFDDNYSIASSILSYKKSLEEN